MRPRMTPGGLRCGQGRRPETCGVGHPYGCASNTAPVIPPLTLVIPAKAGIYAAGRDDARRLAVWGIPMAVRRTQPPSYPHSPSSFPRVETFA